MKINIPDLSESICGALSDAGFTYEIEFDNRGGKRSRYVYVRKPVAAKIRVSDHASRRIEKDKDRAKVIVLDVGPHGLSCDEAMKALHEASRQVESHSSAVVRVARR